MKIIRAEPSRRCQFGELHVEMIDRLFFKSESRMPGFHCRMFYEDFGRLLNSFNRRHGEDFKIASTNAEIVHRLLGNVKTRNAPRSIDGAVRELVEETAQSLIWFQKAYFFAYTSLNGDDVHVAPLNSSGIVRIFGGHVQWVPKGWEKRRRSDEQICSRELRILDAAKLIRIEMPRAFRRMLSAQNKVLASLDEHHLQFGNFHPEATHENPNPSSHFEFGVWKKVQDDAFYRATRQTGWNGRKYDSSKRSDFFDCHRLIRFRSNQLFLRDVILSQLSREFSRIGKNYDERFSMEILPSDESLSILSLEKLKLKLEREEIEFKEVLDYCYGR